MGLSKNEISKTGYYNKKKKQTLALNYFLKNTVSSL